MKKFLLPLIALLAFGATGCKQIVPAGNVGIKVYLLGGDKGVEQETLGVGKHYIGWNEELYLFPTFEQNPKYTKTDTETDAGREVEFQTKEGMSVDADFSVTYVIEPSNAALVFQRYRQGVDEINKGPLRNIVRDAVGEVTSKLPVEDVYGPGKAQMMADIEALVKARAKESGLTVKSVSLLGAVRLPPSVNAALNAKMEATQLALKIENELRSSEAQAKKDVAQAEGAAKVAIAAAEGEAQSIRIRAEAQAKANRILADSITSTLVEYEKVKKWNGATPQVMGSNGAQFLTLPK